VIDLSEVLAYLKDIKQELVLVKSNLTAIKTELDEVKTELCALKNATIKAWMLAEWEMEIW
jgi:hypothetical protein